MCKLPEKQAKLGRLNWILYNQYFVEKLKPLSDTFKQALIKLGLAKYSRPSSHTSHGVCFYRSAQIPNTRGLRFFLNFTVIARGLAV